MFSKSIQLIPLTHSRLQGGIITIEVGEERQVYVVHERLIRASSPFFDRAMSGRWRESAQRTVTLPDDDPWIFGIYVHWLYHGTIASIEDNDEFMDLAKAFVLGDKLLDSKFNNAVIDAIVDKSRFTLHDGNMWFPSERVVEYIYAHTTESSPIRELMVDLWASSAAPSSLSEWKASLSAPRSFLIRLVCKLMGQRLASENKWFDDWREPDAVSQMFFLQLASKLLKPDGCPRELFAQVDPFLYHCLGADDEICSST